MKIIDAPISKEELKKMSEVFAGGLVKAVVDIKKEIIALDAPMHADEEKELLERGSDQDDLWGINIYPDLSGEEFIDFDSMINVRPRMNNFSRTIEDTTIQKTILLIVSKLIV